MSSCLFKSKFLITVLMFGASAQAQIIKTGKTDNSIVVKNINAGFDVGESEATVSFSNYFKPVLIKPRGILFAVNGKTKNEDGLAEWFNTGTFQPSSSINGLLGWYCTSVTDNEFDDITDSDDILDEYKTIKENIQTKFTTLISTAKYSLTVTEQQKETLYVNSMLSNKISTFNKFRDDLQEKIDVPSGNSGLDALYKDMHDYLTTGSMADQIASFYAHQTFVNNHENDISNILSTRKFWTLKIYGTGGVNSEKFTLFPGWKAGNLEKSFNKEYFRGGNIGVGVNVSIRGKWMIGIMDRYEELNNTELLTAKSYTVTSTVTDSNQTAKSTKEVKAYATSEYAKVYFNSLYVDLMRYFPITKDSCIIVADVYFRNRHSNNNTQFATHSDIGISGGIFKNSGKFIGGLYLELPDINEKLAKMDPEYISKPFYNRMTFGVYAKISFTTLLTAL